ncbi:MAG: hypothetical protein GY751_08075 [Bacteroidetes bacterium]|nr:hypothetical protein [Bacteroidota bacterium]
MGAKDFLLAPLFILVIYTIAGMIKKRYIAPDDPAGKYFFKGLHLKMLGALATAMIYWYYYGNGDTIYYYKRIYLLHNLIVEGRGGLRVLFYSKETWDFDIAWILDKMRYFDKSYFKVIQIGTIISFFGLNTYLGIAFIFSFISYLGLWMLYRVFYGLYPKLYRPLAYSVLYVPSIVFWGSGLFKDTITMGAVGGLVYSTYSIFIRPKRVGLNIVLAIINVYLIVAIKAYIIACILPFILVWVVLTRRNRIKSRFIRMSLTPILMLGTVLGGFVMTKAIAAQSDRFSLDQLEKRAEDMVWWHDKVKEIYGEDGGGGSNYTIGNPYDFSPLGIAKKLPLAVNVTYFRPYFWEAGNPVMQMSAIESFLIFILFLVLIVKMRLGFFRRIFADPFLLFCFGFSILFAVGVGLTSANFGALVRYKIPSLPFFIAMLVILYYQRKERVELKKERKNIENSRGTGLSDSAI